MGALRCSGRSRSPRASKMPCGRIGEYLRQTFAPSGFAIVYPLSASVFRLGMIACGLAAVTGIAVHQRQHRPWILTGWLWFLIALAPTLGIIQAGVQARADRFTYIPHIGLFIAVVWSAAEFIPARFHAFLATLAILACAFLANRQVPAWRDSETIFAQALRNTSDNWLAEHKYGLALLERNDTAGAEKHFAEPRHSTRRILIADFTRAHRGGVKRHSEALDLFTETVRLKPDYADAHYSRASCSLNFTESGGHRSFRTSHPSGNATRMGISGTHACRRHAGSR